MDSFVLDSFQISDTGKVRELNEDNVGCFVSKDKAVRFYIVADGMGGHLAGEVASQMAVEIFGEAACKFEYSDEEALRSFLSEIVDVINKKIRKKSSESEKCRNMGTTAVIYAATESFGLFCNVGDSRGYIISDEGIKQITKDHSLVQSMIDDGYIFGDEAQKHHFSHVITRALGFLKTDKEDEKTCDLFKVQPMTGEMVILCSDGLTNMIEDEDICKTVLAASSLEDAGKELVRIANENGGHDNITVSLIRYRGGEKI